MSSSHTPTSSNHDRWVKRVFVAVIVLFPFQYWFAVNVTEPYPALKLPAFVGARVDAEGNFLIRYPEVIFHFSDGSSRPITLRRLFGKIPSSQFTAMAEMALKPKPRGPRPQNPFSDAGWKNYIPWNMFPGYLLTKQRRLYWDGIEPATRAWIQERGRELFPDKTAVKISVYWYQELFRWQDGLVSRERALTDTLEENL